MRQELIILLLLASGSLFSQTYFIVNQDKTLTITPEEKIIDSVFFSVSEDSLMGFMNIVHKGQSPIVLDSFSMVRSNYSYFPEDAYCLNLDIYSKGNCTWFSIDSLHICYCHKTQKVDYDKMELYNIVNIHEFPTDTNPTSSFQIGYTTSKNQLIINYFDYILGVPFTERWEWNAIARIFELKNKKA